MKRVLAAAAALGMIGLSLFVRGRIDDDGGTAKGGGSPKGTPVLVCDAGLKDVCAALGPRYVVRIEKAADTAAALAAGTSDLDGWLAPAPWAASVADGLGEPSAVIARSPVVIAMFDERLRALGSRCPTVTWLCLADAAGKPWADAGGDPLWGRVKVGVLDPGTGGGLVVLGSVGGSLANRTDFAANDFSDVFTEELRALAAGSDDADPLTAMVQFGASRYAAAGALEAQAAGILDAPRAAGIKLIYPSPVVTADLVLSQRVGERRLDDLLTDTALRDSLVASGWKIGGSSLPPGSNLPKPSVLTALSKLWSKVR
jgi:hypothetical protein